MESNIDVSKFLSPDKLTSARISIEEKCSDPMLLRMLEDGLHADITLTAQGGTVKAHRSVLASVSPVFHAMFQHDMKEHLTSSVDISDMSIDSLRLFLLLLYITNDRTSAMPELNSAVDKHFVPFHEAYHKYQVLHRLKPVYEEALGRNLTPENCWEYYRYHQSLDSELEKGEFGAVNVSAGVSICSKYMLENYVSVINCDSFLLEMGRNPKQVHKFLKRATSRVLPLGFGNGRILRKV